MLYNLHAVLLYGCASNRHIHFFYVNREVERYGQLFAGSIWNECGQLQSRKRSKHWFIFYIIPTLSVVVKLLIVLSSFHKIGHNLIFEWNWYLMRDYTYHVVLVVIIVLYWLVQVLGSLLSTPTIYLVSHCCFPKCSLLIVSLH